MALYDGLPLNTLTKVADDGIDIETWATRTSNPPVGGNGTVERRQKPGGPSALATAGQANAQTMQVGLVAALPRIRQIKTQAAAFASQADYGAMNLAALNDLLHKSQSIATAVGDLADDIRYLARLAANQLDATT